MSNVEVLFMFFIIWDLAKKSKAGRLGTAILFLGLGLCLFAFLAKPIGAGVTTLGVPIGMGVILFTIAITVYYVRIANNKFDALTEEILKDVTK